MHSHIAIFPATGIPSSQWIYRDRVQRPEMSLDAANLVLEDPMVEPSFEFALTGGGGGHVRGGLATAENDEVLFGGDGRREEGGVSKVGFEKLECSCRYHLIVGS